MFGLIPPACYPLVSICYQAGSGNLLTRGLPVKGYCPSGYYLQKKAHREYVFRKVIINSNGAIKVWWATKLRSHKKKSFPNEQGNNSRYLLIFGLIYVGFIVM